MYYPGVSSNCRPGVKDIMTGRLPLKPLRKGSPWKASFTLGRANTCDWGMHVYQVKPKHGHGKQRILHRNLLLPCDALPLPRQMTVMSNTTQLLSRALPQPQNPGEFPRWVWDGNIIFCSYPWNILSRGWRHPIYVPAWPPWPGGLYQYGICIN